MNIIEARMQGGLGNQMFIAATAKTLALRIDGEMHFDTSSYQVGDTRKFDLDIFGLEYTTIEKTSRTSNRKWMTALPNKRKEESPIPLFREEGFGFDSKFNLVSSSARIDGYFQSWKYFSNADKEIRKMFQLAESNKLLDGIVAKVGKNFTAVHIRRGDYLLPGSREFHGIASENYFKLAINFLRGDKRSNEPIVFFSDSPETLSPDLRKFADLIVEPDLKRHPAFDLLAMSCARNFIISNSSFGWWGAFLGETAGRIVIAPRPWFRAGDVSGSDLLLPNWISLGS